MANIQIGKNKLIIAREGDDFVRNEQTVFLQITFKLYEEMVLDKTNIPQYVESNAINQIKELLKQL